MSAGPVPSVDVRVAWQAPAKGGVSREKTKEPSESQLSSCPSPPPALFLRDPQPKARSNPMEKQALSERRSEILSASAGGLRNLLFMATRSRTASGGGSVVKRVRLRVSTRLYASSFQG